MESVARLLGIAAFFLLVAWVNTWDHPPRPQHYSPPPVTYETRAQPSLADQFPRPAIHENAYPQTRFTYDATSGNSYQTMTYGDGRTTVYGSNARTGARWTSYVEADGSQHGFDADGRAWSCVGTGATQVCN